MKMPKAKIGSDGLIGNKIVVIYGGTPAAPSIKANDILPVEAALSTEEMMNSLQENNKNLLAITGDFKMISRRLANGEGTVGRLLTDDSFMDQLQTTAATLEKASSNIQLLSSNMADYTAKLQTKGVLANDLVSDTTIFKSLRSSVAQIQEASDNAKELTNNLKAVTQKINDSSNTVGVLLHDQQSADNLGPLWRTCNQVLKNLMRTWKPCSIIFCSGVSLEKKQSVSRQNKRNRWQLINKRAGFV
jgi:hypothetical protein